MTLREAYQQFHFTHPDAKIGKSKFASLRPPNVLLCDDTPLNVCVCVVHYNFIHMLKVLSPYLESYHNHWIEQYVVCHPPSSQCYFNECNNCKNAASLDHLGNVLDETIVTFSQWLKQHNIIFKREQFVKVKVSQPIFTLLMVSLKRFK
jgi:hypothetical protein